MNAIIKSRGGLITWFRREPDGGLWIALSCATHRDWAIEWRFVPEVLASPAGRIALESVSTRLVCDAFDSRQSCACATPLRIT